MEELYRQANKYSMLEDNICATTQTVMITSQPVEGHKSFGKKPSESKEGHSRDRKQSSDQAHKKREPLQFIPQNISYERLLLIIHDFPEFKWPAPIQTDPSQRNKSLRCDYHRDHRHETDKCRSLMFLYTSGGMSKKQTT